MTPHPWPWSCPQGQIFHPLSSPYIYKVKNFICIKYIQVTARRLLYQVFMQYNNTLTWLSWVSMSTTIVVLHSTYNASCQYLQLLIIHWYKQRCSNSDSAPSPLLADQWVFFFLNIFMHVSLFLVPVWVKLWKYAFFFLGLLFLLLGSLMNRLLSIGYVIFYLPFVFGDTQFEIKAYLLEKSCRIFLKHWCGKRLSIY